MYEGFAVRMSVSSFDVTRLKQLWNDLVPSGLPSRAAADAVDALDAVNAVDDDDEPRSREKQVRRTLG